MISPAEYYVKTDGPLRQGDVLLASVVRLVAPDRFSPGPWDELDDAFSEVHPTGHYNRPLLGAAGPALVMVTSHDCHFDKEWNREVRRLTKEGVRRAEAQQRAEANDALDRTFCASPLIRPEDIPVAKGELMAGKVVGYLPVHESLDGLVPECLVDLTYRVTLDRLDEIRRVASISDQVRAQLRYGLARLDSLRATEVGFRVEEVVGQRITAVDFPSRSPLEVLFSLEDGQVIRLLQQPGEPGPGPARQGAPAEPANS